MTLVTVADCAYPFDYSRLPRGVVAVLGYVGAPDGTPHVWSNAEVAAVRNRGLMWAPIYTPPAATFSHQLGLQAGNAMVAALARYQLHGTEPVFLDIEQHVDAADPAGALAGAKAWQGVMHSAGWVQAWPYLPARVQFGWVADWVGAPPRNLAAGVVGVQYAGGVDGDRYDLSVFDAAVFAALAKEVTTMTTGLTKADQVWLVDQLHTVQQNLQLNLDRYVWDNNPARPVPHALTHLHALLNGLTAKLATLGPTPADVHTLADQVAALLGPELAGQVAAELSRRLTS